MPQTSRSIGDRAFKSMDPPFVPATPLTGTRTLSAAERDGGFVVLASDGVWEVFSNERAVELVRSTLAEGGTPQAAATALCEGALAKGSEDNICTAVVTL